MLVARFKCCGARASVECGRWYQLSSFPGNKKARMKDERNNVALLCLGSRSTSVCAHVCACRYTATDLAMQVG